MINIPCKDYDTKLLPSEEYYDLWGPNLYKLGSKNSCQHAIIITDFLRNDSNYIFLKKKITKKKTKVWFLTV